jgi:hypothetical protein
VERSWHLLGAVFSAAVEVVGLILIPVGVWFIYEPAALIVGGCLLLAASYLHATSRPVQAPGGERE